MAKQTERPWVQGGVEHISPRRTTSAAGKAKESQNTQRGKERKMGGRRNKTEQPGETFFLNQKPTVGKNMEGKKKGKTEQENF